jgi:hypothetical protein
MNDHSKVGEQGVSLAVVELLERGLSPYRPVVDDHGVDLLLLNGIRIQVKSAHLSKYRSCDRSRTYQFSCSQNVYGTGGRARALTWKRRVFASYCDFLILVGLDQRRFWVVPAAFVDAYGDMNLTMSERDDPAELLRINELVEQGKELTEIANELGCSVTTVWKRRKGIRARRTKVKALRAYENRWDLLKNPKADEPSVQLPTIYERDPDFVATLAGPIAA